MSFWLALGLSLGLTQGEVNPALLLVNRCDTRLYLYTPHLRSREVAEALHTALTRRGVPLVVLAPKTGLTARQGVGVGGLVLAGGQLLVLRQNPTLPPMLLCEGRYALEGEWVDGLPLGVSPPLLTQPAEVNRVARALAALVGRAIPVAPEHLILWLR